LAAFVIGLLCIPFLVTYLRSQLSSESADVKDDIDRNFLSDNYWLLFLLHAYWDTSATVTDEGTKKLPIGTGSAALVSVKYPAEAGGYTPGDTWDLYVGKDYRVVAMVYHRDGPKKPRLISVTWAGYKKGRSSADFNGAPRHRRR
jgi:hypothetical protein